MGRQPAGHSGTDAKLQARARVWAERWCLDQGLAFEIADRKALAEIAELIGIAGQRRKTARRRDSSKGAL